MMHPNESTARIHCSSPFGGKRLLPWIGGILLSVLAPSAGAWSRGIPGEILDHPDPGIGSKTFIVDSSSAGQARKILLMGLYWGRLVDVADASGQTQNTDYVIGENIRNGSIFNSSVGPVVYTLSSSPFTGRTVVQLSVLADTVAYEEAFQNLDANLVPMLNKGLPPDDIGPWSMAPRNSAMVIRLDDLLDPYFADGGWRDSYGGGLINAASGQLSSQVVRVCVGYPPTAEFEARLILDKNHGDLADFDGNGVDEFHATRVIIDPVISELEAEYSNPPLTPNSTGFPASDNASSPNGVIRIPTRLDPSVGQTQLLVNPIGRGLSFLGNDPNDPASPTRDVLRAFRTGGKSVVTGDLNNGFLLDDVPPNLIGEQVVDLRTTPTEVRPGIFSIAKTSFEVTPCATPPKPGDVLRQGSTLAEILQSGALNGVVLDDLLVRVLIPAGGTVSRGQAKFLTTYDPMVDSPPCFVTFAPEALDPPEHAVSNRSAVHLRFTEPMDLETITPFDSFTITRVPANPTAFDYVVGQVKADRNLQEFSWEHPQAPFPHSAGTSEAYFMNLVSGSDGAQDLAGNPLAFPFPQVPFYLDPGEPTEVGGGVVLHFASQDELYGDGFPELRDGQLLYDFQQERILPRPVSRFSSAADTNQPLPSVMTPFIGGVQTPLSPLGSKLHAVWRYCDLGFSHTDEANFNLDVEGLAWAPAGSNVAVDAYDQFEIRLAHSKHLPDEILDSAGFPRWPNSGLKLTYANNYLDPVEDPGTIVHPRDLGYVVNPANLFVATSQTVMLPFPLNQDLPAEDYRYYTWRDTGVLAVGGDNGAGVPPDQEIMVLGLTGPKMYTPGNVKTLGLPLLMEFRCYPDDNALGLNGFNIALACNSSARPNFRAFSTGGYDVNNLPVIKDPDLEDTATGGFNPGSNPPGAPTLGVDCSLYFGEVALVTRISRVHTVWFDTSLADPTYLRPVLEPLPAHQNEGTRVSVAFRGATAIANMDSGSPPNDIRRNAGLLDPYGEKDPLAYGSSSPVFLNGDSTWKDNISAINSSRYFQVRITFIANTVTNRTSELHSLGFCWRS